MRSRTVGRPSGSLIVETTPRGLWSTTYPPLWRTTRVPSTSTRAALGSTLVPSSVITRPSTRTRPAEMSSSAARRDATPAWARTFCSRTVAMIRAHSVLARPLRRPSRPSREGESVGQGDGDGRERGARATATASARPSRESELLLLRGVDLAAVGDLAVHAHGDRRRAARAGVGCGGVRLVLRRLL